MQNCLTLMKRPIEEHLIPVYPSFELKKAKKGDITYDLDPSCKLADGKPTIIIEREARPGELLRDVDLRYLTDTSKNEFFRGQRKRMANADSNFRAMELRFCRSSILYFCNVYCYTKIPGQAPVPFITFPFQDDILTWVLWLIRTRGTGVIEKSREMGMSWIMQVIVAYISLFFVEHDSFQLSMTENDVDNKTEHSLFGKLRYLLRYLPEWMQGGWKEGVRDGNDLKMLIRIPKTSSTTEGVLTGGKAGRGGRAVLAFYDEYAHIDTATESAEASASASKTKIYLSTPNGSDNMFAKMAFDPRTSKKTLHWRCHPLKTEEWAIRERSRPEYTEEGWAQEHDIDYHRSKKGRVYPMFLRSKLDEHGWQHVQYGDYFEYDPAYSVEIGMDFGYSDPNALVYAQIKPCLPHFPTADGNMIVIFAEDWNRYQLAQPLADMILSYGYRLNNVIGDMYSATKTSQTDGKTIIDVLAANGIHLDGNRNTADAPVGIVKNMLGRPGVVAVNGANCPRTIKAFENWSHRVDKNTGFAIPGSSPKHDENSHIMKAVAYLFDFVFGIETQQTVVHQDWDYTIISDNIGI